MRRKTPQSSCWPSRSTSSQRKRVSVVSYAGALLEEHQDRLLQRMGVDLEEAYPEKGLYKGLNLQKRSFEPPFGLLRRIKGSVCPARVIASSSS